MPTHPSPIALKIFEISFGPVSFDVSILSVRDLRSSIPELDRNN